MKRVSVTLFCVLLILGFSTQAIAQCTTLQEGTLVYSTTHYSNGNPIPMGFDAYGYNYQAHMFNGSYFNVYSGGANFPPYEGDDAAYLAVNPSAASHWAWPYRSAEIVMKWNDAWLSNEDCDNDGKLDRHYGYPSYIGSGAWETNHQSGMDILEGKKCKWIYFCKIVAAPSDAEKTDGIWYTPTGAEIGPVIWGEFATIQEVYNDPCAAAHGVAYLSPVGPGFGHID